MNIYLPFRIHGFHSEFDSLHCFYLVVVLVAFFDTHSNSPGIVEGWAFVCVYMCIYVYVCVCMGIYVYICVYMCMLMLLLVLVLILILRLRCRKMYNGVSRCLKMPQDVVRYLKMS